MLRRKVKEIWVQPAAGEYELEIGAGAAPLIRPLVEWSVFAMDWNDNVWRYQFSSSSPPGDDLEMLARAIDQGDTEWWEKIEYYFADGSYQKIFEGKDWPDRPGFEDPNDDIPFDSKEEDFIF